MGGGAQGLAHQWKLLKRSPAELRLLYVLNFLNSYMYFSTAMVLPLIATEEYGLTDVQSGTLYATWGLLITAWGFVASWMVDSLGVRTTAIFSCALCAISRVVVVFGRSTASLYIAMLVLSPAGDGTFNPCFTVGLKKCTTDVTRPFAYALAYTVSNLGGAFSANLMDVVRRAEVHMLGSVFSGLRCVVASSLLLMLGACVLALQLRDLSEVEAEATANSITMTPPMRSTPQMRRLARTRGLLSPASQSLRASVQARAAGSQQARNEKKPLFGAMRRPADSAGECSYRRLESPRWGPMAAHEAISEARERSERKALQQQQQQHDSTTSRYQQKPLPARPGAPGALSVVVHSSGKPSIGGGARSSGSSAGASGIGGLVVKEEKEDGADEEVDASIFMDANFWRVVVFTACVLFTSQQWRYQDLILPKYATRFFGDAAPFADIKSINFWGCVFLPPLVSSWTSGMDDLAVMLPGLWAFSLAALPLVYYDALWAVSLWMLVLTLGEVVWSPRSASYAASMAPVGREGIFLMMSSWPTYLTKYPAGYFSGWLLSKYSPDCPSCKDATDLFCAPFPVHGQCVSLVDQAPSCPLALLQPLTSAFLEAANSSLSGFASSASTAATTSDEAALSASSSIDSQFCAQSCQECPGWSGDGSTLFLWVLGCSLISPVLITLLFPCLRRPDQSDPSSFSPAASPSLPTIDAKRRFSGSAASTTTTTYAAVDSSSSSNNSSAEAELELGTVAVPRPLNHPMAVPRSNSLNTL